MFAVYSTDSSVNKRTTCTAGRWSAGRNQSSEVAGFGGGLGWLVLELEIEVDETSYRCVPVSCRHKVHMRKNSATMVGTLDRFVRENRSRGK